MYATAQHLHLLSSNSSNLFRIYPKLPKNSALTGEDNDELDSEISAVNEILAELIHYKDEKSKSLYIYNINNLLVEVAETLFNDLQTAKTFKVNRNEFLGNVTHELRTPIFAIELSLETLVDGAMNDKTVAEDFLQRAIKQTYRLKDLVDDLISISKFEAGNEDEQKIFQGK